MPNDRTNIRQPRSSDNKLTFQTYEALVDFVKRFGLDGRDRNGDAFINAARNIPVESEIRMAKITGREQSSGSSGSTIPDDTPVYAYSGEEVKWDSSSNTYPALVGGATWDGVDKPLLRLPSQPGFSDSNYDYGPLLMGAIVPVYRLKDDATYSSPSEVDEAWLLDGDSWQILYLGSDPVVHPFKCRVDPTDLMQVIIGYMRDHSGNAGDGSDVATTSHTGSDYITIVANGADAKKIELNTADTVTATGDGWVYYEIDQSSTTPTETAKFTEVWPPNPDPKKLIFQVCYVKIATIASVEQIYSLGQLLFDNVTLSQGGGGDEQVDKSVTFQNAKIVFENDLTLNLAAARPFDNEVDVELKTELGIPIDKPPAFLGSATTDEGPACYAGMEDDGGSYGVPLMRQYMMLSSQNDLDKSLLQPHDQGDAAHTDSNKSWIRLVDAIGRSGKMIKHGVLPQGREAIAAWMFPNAPAAGLALIDWTAFNALPAGNLTKAQLVGVIKQAYFDKVGQLYKLDSSYGDDDSGEDPYDPDNPNKPTGVDLELVVSGYPSSGSLFNVSITQTTKITDGAGVTTVIYNGNNALQYTIEDGTGIVSELNFPDFSTLSSVKGSAGGFN